MLTAPSQNRGGAVFMIYKFLSISTLFLLVSVTGISIEAQEKQHDFLNPGKYQIKEIVKDDWFDKNRKRKIPVKFYLPQATEKAMPIIIFSHGLGGSRDGYSYLGKYWASHGYFVVHLQHPGSDIEVIKQNQYRLKEAMQEAAFDLSNLVNRPLDITFAIDQINELNKSDSELKGKLNTEAIGVAGHSFGAYTTLAIIGRLLVGPNGIALTFTDHRVKAAVALSPGASNKKSNSKKTFDSIETPCLHITGTEDKPVFGPGTPGDRRTGFDNISLADQYLIIFKGADHMVFSGRKRILKSPVKNEKAIQKLTQISTTAFFDAYLKNEPSAKKFLTDGELKKLLGDKADYEKKAGKPIEKD
jgi:predicted dienelactone hydrolase